MTKCFVLLAALVSALPCAAATQTPWPADIGNLKPDVSRSPVLTEFPTGVELLAPPADLPSDKAKWAGLWKGWGCPEKACDLKLVVLSVSPEGAKVIQLYGARNAVPNPAVRDAVFVENELQINAGQLKVAYRMRPDGNIEMFRVAPNGSTAWGVLQKAN